MPARLLSLPPRPGLTHPAEEGRLTLRAPLPYGRRGLFGKGAVVATWAVGAKVSVLPGPRTVPPSPNAHLPGALLSTAPPPKGAVVEQWPKTPRINCEKG